ncbi:MAG: restriction endonuclease subunit S [Fibrobacter sp.]|nr:restriction endonuclease subunit S [Fibrobacter sp.]
MIKINQVHHNQVHQENHENHGSDNVESEAGMSEWKECKLGDIASSNLKSITKDYSYETIYYLDTGSITCGKLESYQKLSLGDSPSRAKRIVSDNDIVYSNVRPIQRHYGIIKNPPENLIASTGFSVISVDKTKADARFVYDFLTSNEIVEYLDSVAEGSTSAYPSLRPADIDNLTILLPPLPEQKAIASVLSSLDNKIDLLNRQNKTLEAMAETLFRQWFIEPCKDGLPQGWREGSLFDVIELHYGKGLKTEERAGNGYPVVGSSGIVDYHSDFLVEGPGIVIGRKGTLGKVIYLWDSFYPIDTTYYIKSKIESAGLLYEYFLLKTINFEDMNTDSAVPGLNRDIALSTEIQIPPKHNVYKFNDLAVTFTNKLKNNLDKIHILEKLRDTLLPKLMSGEVRVTV